MVGEILAGWVMTKSLDRIWGDFTDEDPDLKKDILSCAGKAIAESLTKYDITEWNQEDFEEYVIAKNEIRIVDMLFYTNEEWKKLAKDFLNDNHSEIFDDDWVQCFEEIYKEKLIASDYIEKYLIVSILQTNERNKRETREETQKLSDLLLKDIQHKKEQDLYEESDILDNVIYPFLSEYLKPGCSVWLLELAYALADIYDRTSKYEKSMEIVNKILDMVDKTGRVKTKDNLQKLIGCTYSYIIAKVDNSNRKEKMLKKAGEDMEKIRAYIDTWNVATNKERLFIEGLFESDYGAYFLNMSDLAKKQGKKKDCKRFLKDALLHHKKGEEYRKELVEHVVSKYDDDYLDNVRRYFQSKSNVAGTLYRWEMFDEALIKHKEVLEYRERNGEISNVILSKDYITGCYLGLMKKINISDEQMVECQTYLNECEEYYQKKGDTIRLDEIERKKRKFDVLKQKTQKNKRDKQGLKSGKRKK